MQNFVAHFANTNKEINSMLMLMQKISGGDRYDVKVVESAGQTAVVGSKQTLMYVIGLVAANGFDSLTSFQRAAVGE